MIKLFWYGTAVLGPVAAAGSQFLLSIHLLKSISPGAFGSFSFLLVVLQLSFGLSSAVLCTPYAIQLHDSSRQASAVRQTFMSANLVASLLGGLVLVALSFTLRLSTSTSVLFGLYGMAMLLRWFGRASAYIAGTPWRTVVSDIVYGAVLVVIIFGLRPASLSLEYACTALLISAVFGLIPLGRGFLGAQLRLSPQALRRYAEVWQQHSRWSLIGVLTTEATANAQAYIVTLIGGPAAFAPIAASALLLRPVQLVQNGLIDFERPGIVRRLAAGTDKDADHNLFRFVLFGVWLLSAIFSFAFILWRPSLLFPARYLGPSLFIAVTLWILIAGVRILRTPDNVLLQAAGRFRTLANASLTSCGFSIAVVLLLTVFVGPIWSLLGVLFGETVFAWQVLVRKRRFRRETATKPTPGAVDPETIGIQSDSAQ